MTLYQCDSSQTSWTNRCLRQADCILIVAMGQSKECFMTSLWRFFAIMASFGIQVANYRVLIYASHFMTSSKIKCFWWRHLLICQLWRHKTRKAQNRRTRTRTRALCVPCPKVPCSTSQRKCRGAYANRRVVKFARVADQSLSCENSVPYAECKGSAISTRAN